MIKLLRSYFGFTRKELNGILVLCIILFLVVIFPFLYEMVVPPQVPRVDTFGKDVNQFLASARKTNAQASRSDLYEASELLKPTYFRFDPNGLDESSWARLGLSHRQIRVIKNYEAKGGRFYSKGDLRKMYSISEEKYLELEPYIMIRQERESVFRKFRSGDQQRKHSSTQIPNVVVELNTADSVELETVRGIGPAFASRIVRYRNRLGGFYDKEQLRDVYGIDSLKFEQLQHQLRVDPSALNKIDINKATFDEVRKHPYLSYKLANAIIQYRRQHGNYHSADDLRKIAIMDDEILRKIEPYLIFNDPVQP